MQKYNLIFIGVDLTNTCRAGSFRIRNLLDSFINDIGFDILNINTNGYQKTGKLYKNINIITLDGPFRFLKFFNILRRKVKTSDKNILVNYGPPKLNNIIYILIAKCLKYKIVFDIVEDYFNLDDIFTIKDRIKNTVSKLLILKLHYLASGCFVISNRLYHSISHISKSRFPVFYTPISVNISEFSYGNNINNKNNLTIFYGGTFGLKDGLTYLLKAFDVVADDYDNVVLNLCGAASQKNLLNTLKLIDNLKNKDRVNMMGILRREDYIKCLLSSDILCVIRTNSIYANSGFPFKLGEYLAAGKAIICSRTGDISNYLQDKKDLVFVNPESVESIVSAMVILLKDNNLRIRLGRQARQKAFENFDSHKVSGVFKRNLLIVANN